MTEVLLYALHLSTPKPGFVKGPVDAVEAKVYGIYIDGKPYKPNPNATEDCLPHFYKKAFKRAGNFWFNSSTDIFNLTLYGCRQKYLNTLYAIPYMFDPTTGISKTLDGRII